MCNLGERDPSTGKAIGGTAIDMAAPLTCVIAIRVTPRSSKPGIGGWRMGADGREELELRVAAAPADGEANTAVVQLLAKALGVPRGSIEIVSGAASRHKRIAVPLSDDEFRARFP